MTTNSETSEVLAKLLALLVYHGADERIANREKVMTQIQEAFDCEVKMIRGSYPYGKWANKNCRRKRH